ncbi:hypothetical protein C8J56DRAFT_765085, partial [Mycena floridula]
LQQAIQAAVPVTKPSPFMKRWWTKEASALIVQYRKAQHKFHRNPSEENKSEKNRARNAFRKHIKTSKRETWNGFVEEITPKTVYTAAKIVTD